MGLDLSRRVAGRKNYPYANARVRAMRGNLLTDQEYRKLAKMELSEIAEFIGNRGYGTEIEELGGELRDEDLVERAVRLHLSRTYRKLIRISPDPVRTLLRTYYRKFDIENMKILLRRQVRGDDGDIRETVVPTPELDLDRLERLDGMDSVAAMLDALDLSDLDGDVLDRVDGTDDPAAVEDALDVHYYTGLIGTLAEADLNSRMFGRFLELEAALMNVSLILRMQRRGYGHQEIMDRLIPLPGDRQVVDEEELARIDAEDELLARVRESDIGDHIDDETTSPAEIERALEQYKLERGVRLMHTDQLGVNPLLGFMVCTETEAGNLRMIARARAEGLGSDFIERNLVRGVAR